MNLIKEKFRALTPGQQRLTTVGLFFGTVLLLACFFGAAGGSGSDSRAERKEGAAGEIRFDESLLERNKYREQSREIEKLRQELARLREEGLAEERDAGEAAGQEASAEYPQVPAMPTAEEIMARPGTGFPLPEGLQGAPGPPPDYQPPPPPPAETLVGGIMVVSGPAGAPAAEPEGDKKKERAVYLPPSFMEAELLTGFDASTMGSGDSNPEPLLLRIQAPAMLPNRIKAGLQGCFMVAEGTGKLNKERADVRLINLACLSRSGEAVIDSAVKGFVVGSDGKVGLAGRVVSRMGAATARAVIAGIFGGAGEALQSAGLSQSVSPLGTTSTINSSELAKAAGGKGLAEGANTLRDFYLQLAKQTTPVIEVGPTQKVTAVIAEGVELKIKNMEQVEF